MINEQVVDDLVNWTNALVETDAKEFNEVHYKLQRKYKDIVEQSVLNYYHQKIDEF